MDPSTHPETRFLHAVEMGVGTWQWGDRIVWNYDSSHTKDFIRAAFNASLEQGIRLFDTAEIYGNGQSERILGQLLKETNLPVLVATKFMPFPWRLERKSLLRALKHSLNRLGLESVDLYQMHWPFPIVSIERWMSAMAEAVQQGLARTVGVSNYNYAQMMRAFSALERRNIPLASNQVEYNLLNREIEKNGLLKRCQELGIRVIAYSPLAMGLLTGKYGPENPPPGLRGRKYASQLKRLKPLLNLMTEIGREHESKTCSQVALNWCICKGTLPIPGAKNAEQALMNAGALGWRLTEEEVARLDHASENVTG
ncbi:MAG: aldo/keto reductase [Candidatus Villigracilaceae bacterium]